VFLFIFESIGTSELILVGIVALIFLGPRKLPELAKKAGKIMAEFRGTANEFKETWEREATFEEEKKMLSLDDLDDDTVPREASAVDAVVTDSPPESPAIRAADPEEFKHLLNPTETEATIEVDAEEPQEILDTNDKKTWL
jgi:sec-independent protein translocase protein TatB